MGVSGVAAPFQIILGFFLFSNYSRHVVSYRLVLLQRLLLLPVEFFSDIQGGTPELFGDGRRSSQHQQPGRDGFCPQHLV